MCSKNSFTVFPNLFYVGLLANRFRLVGRATPKVDRTKLERANENKNLGKLQIAKKNPAFVQLKNDRMVAELRFFYDVFVMPYPKLAKIEVDGVLFDLGGILMGGDTFGPSSLFC